MRFILDTNILIPLEDSKRALEPSLANFVRLANAHGHVLLYHPASEEDIQQDSDHERRAQTLSRLRQYTRLDNRPTCPWNTDTTCRNDAADNEILYALSLNAAHALVTEDRGIHSKARTIGLDKRVYTIQTAEDQLLRLHQPILVQLPNIEDVPLYSISPLLQSEFFDSLRAGYPEFDEWFESKSQEGRQAWVSKEQNGDLAGICIYARQEDERITEDTVLPGASLKLSTFKVAETSRGKKIGELFLKAAFRYASSNGMENIFVHGDIGLHHFLFQMLEDFGFIHVGNHPGSNGRDAVYLKKHPATPPSDNLPVFEYAKRYFPHFRHDSAVSKFIIPIRPEYHRILFPDYDSPAERQIALFGQPNTAGNAIKMAYLCHSQTKNINSGDIVLFYRSRDDRAITSIGIVESYETLSDPGDVVSKVKRRTVYTMDEITSMTSKPVRVMLFRLIRHLSNPLHQSWLERNHILNGAPQSITRISDSQFERVIDNGR